MNVEKFALIYKKKCYIGETAGLFWNIYFNNFGKISKLFRIYIENSLPVYNPNISNFYLLHSEIYPLTFLENISTTRR